jgi:hypothetical protein
MAHFSFLAILKTDMYMKKISFTLATFFSLAAIAISILSFTSQSSNLDEVIGAIKGGNANGMGKYMDENVEITLPDKSNNYSKAQAVLVLKDFFDNNVVKTFDVKHKGDQNGGQFCVGTLQTKSGNYRTTIFMKTITGKDYVKTLRFQAIE